MECLQIEKMVGNCHCARGVNSVVLDFHVYTKE